MRPPAGRKAAPPPPDGEEDPSRLSFGARLVHAFLRLVIVALAAWIALQLPLPLLDDWFPLKNLVVAVAAILLAGKTLFDTLFYDHFWP